MIIQKREGNNFDILHVSSVPIPRHFVNLCNVCVQLVFLLSIYLVS